MLNYGFMEVDICHRMGRTIANVVLRDLNLRFISMSQICIVNNSETLKLHMTFAEIIICHRMVPLLMMYSVTFAFIFKVKHF